MQRTYEDLYIFAPRQGFYHYKHKNLQLLLERYVEAQPEFKKVPIKLIDLNENYIMLFFDTPKSHDGKNVSLIDTKQKLSKRISYYGPIIFAKVNRFNPKISVPFTKEDEQYIKDTFAEQYYFEDNTSKTTLVLY